MHFQDLTTVLGTYLVPRFLYIYCVGLNTVLVQVLGKRNVDNAQRAARAPSPDGRSEKNLMVGLVNKAKEKYRMVKVRKTPSWPRSWANFSLFLAPFPQEFTGQLETFGPT